MGFFMVIVGFLTNLAQQLTRKKSENPKIFDFGKYGLATYPTTQATSIQSAPANNPP